MTGVLIGTSAGLFQGDGAPFVPAQAFTALARGEKTDWWAVQNDREIVRAEGASWRVVGELAGLAATCLAVTPDDVLVGSSEARLFRFRDFGSRLDGALEPIESFDEAPGRSDWYTPWGGPPDTRSISVGTDGVVYVNVHVGGILRSSGDVWEPTIDIDADVHQVLVGPEPGLVLAATARGLAVSRDGGGSWELHTDGLHGAYCRAVAIAGDVVLVSASTGPFSKQGAVYRTGLPGGSFEHCDGNLPEWFPGNIDTFCLAGEGETVVIGSPEGSLYVSEDVGSRWSQVAEGLPQIRCVAVD